MNRRTLPDSRDLLVILRSGGKDPSPYRLLDSDGTEIEPVGAFLDATALRGLSHATLRTYAFALRGAWTWMRSQGLTLDQLTQAHLLEFIRYLHEKRVCPPAPRSINLWLLALRRLYEFHSGHAVPPARGVSDEPASPFRRPRGLGYPQRFRKRRPHFHVKVPCRLVEPLDRKELARFFASLKTWRDLTIASFMLFCGLRSAEVLGLTLRDIQLDQDQIRVRGKGNKDRVLPLASELHSSLSRYLRHERPHNTTHDALFVVLKGPLRGRPMIPSGLRSVFRHHRKRSSVARANPHRLRHTFAADMVRSGMSVPALMRLMGHSHIDMTLRYINLSAEDIRDEFLAALHRRDRQHSDE
jgi:site-specific recombinase XerD